MMQSRIRISLTLILLLAGIMTAVGCTGKSPRANFYTLGTTSASGPAAALSPDIAIAVGPVSIPAELDRKQIVTRDAGNRVTVAELSRWAAPLQDSIAAVLTANLAARLGTEKVAPFNRESLFPFTHHVILNVNRFDGYPGGDIRLDVTWSVKQSGVSPPLFVKRTEILETAAAPGYAGLVAAQSKALDTLSIQIAEVLVQQAP